MNASPEVLENMDSSGSISFLSALVYFKDIGLLGGELLVHSKTVLLLTLLSILCFLYYALTGWSRSGRMLRKFPNAPKFPLIGSIPCGPISPDDLVQAFQEGIRLFGRRYVIWLGPKPYLIIADPDAVQKVFSSTKHIEKGTDYKQFHWAMGNGLVTSNGTMWKEDRKLLSPSMKYQNFDGFLNHFNKHSSILVQILDKLFKDKSSTDVILHPYLSRATMDFIKEAALGQPSSFQYDLNAELLNAAHLTLKSFRTRLVRPYLTLPIIWEVFGMAKQERYCVAVFSKYIKEVTDKRRALLETQEIDDGETKPFIDALLDTKSDEDITSHISTIFGAGFETTATAMNYTLFLLSLESDCQTKVHQEIDELFGNDDRAVTFQDLAELKFLEMCIKESMRLFPPVPALIRNPTEDIPLDNGQVIPQGVQTLFLLRELHRDPNVFSDPEKFDPKRFLPDACARRHPFAYMPFSAGPRNCLGLKYAMMQMKCCMAHILRHFKVSTNQRKEDIKVIYGLVLEPSPALKMTLTPRK